MVTKTLYTCQFCNTDYVDKKKQWNVRRITKFWRQQQL